MQWCYNAGIKKTKQKNNTPNSDIFITIQIRSIENNSRIEEKESP